VVNNHILQFFVLKHNIISRLKVQSKINRSINQSIDNIAPRLAGFYSDPHCVHLKPGTGHLSATFEIYLNSCGMSSSANHNAAGAYGAPTPSGSYVENTIIIQYDPYVQEVWDQARKLRCTW
jgi:hypothetical protein